MLDLTYRPLPALWPSGERTADHKRRSPNFRTSWTKTMEELQREVGMLGARQAVLEAGFREYDIRNDGLPRANARPQDPAVILNFESRFGPLRYGCDSFTTYEANLLAIARALNALRLVDRYGVTKKGEQYTGWLALPESTLSSEAAKDFIAKHSPISSLIGNWTDAWRDAAKRLHPDVGGSREDWDKLQAAKVALGL